MTVTVVPGAVEVTVVKAGFAPATVSVRVTAGTVQEIVVELQVQPTVEETVTVVATTRTDKSLEDQPMRVEVLAREEIEEKMLMTPGDIVMMLNEMGGMRVQTTSPALGAASHDVPLTPRHSAGIVGMWEKEDVGRIGVEWYYTGQQRLEENPYRSQSESYVILGLLGERQFGRIRVFVNGENLTGVRQTRWDPLLRSTQAADGRWTVDAWAPLEGRNINGGLRVRF